MDILSDVLTWFLVCPWHVYIRYMFNKDTESPVSYPWYLGFKCYNIHHCYRVIAHSLDCFFFFFPHLWSPFGPSIWVNVWKLDVFLDINWTFMQNAGTTGLSLFLDGRYGVTTSIYSWWLSCQCFKLTFRGSHCYTVSF